MLYLDPQIDLGGTFTACTVLIVHGTEDRVVPIAVARDLHARIPSSRLIELTGRGHYFLYDKGEMKSVLTELLQAHRVCSLPRLA